MQAPPDESVVVVFPNESDPVLRQYRKYLKDPVVARCLDVCMVDHRVLKRRDSLYEDVDKFYTFSETPREPLQH